MAHAGSGRSAADTTAIEHQHLESAAGAFRGTSGSDDPRSDDRDVKRLAHDRMPQQNGSASFRISVVSAFTKAVPVMIGSIFPASRSSHRKRALNVLPMMLS